MRNFKIWTVFQRWWWLLVIFSLIGAAGFYKVISGKQTYTAETMIEYVGEGADGGVTPTGVPIDANEIVSSNVIYQAMDDLGISMSVDVLRNGISIIEIPDEDQETLKQSYLAQREAYNYFIKRYIVRLKLGSDYSQEFVRRVLDAVLSSYFTYYAKTYVNVSVVPNNCNYAMDNGYDYIESVEIIDEALKNLIEYLQARVASAAGFRSSGTGCNFDDLLNLYHDLYDLNIDKLYAYVLENAMAKDPALLMEKYVRREADNNIEIAALKEKIDAIARVEDSYVQKSIEGQQRYTTVQEGTNNNSVIAFQGPDTSTDNTTTYDNMVYTEVSYNVQLNALQIDNQYIDYITSRFNQNKDKNTAANAVWLEEKLSDVVSRSKELYSVLLKTVDEYNEYLAVKNVIARSSLRAYAGINIKVYAILAFAFFFIVGVVGSALISFLVSFVSRTLHRDSKTGLLNRMSFDSYLEELSRQPLNADSVCVVHDMKNLILLNEISGRQAGDVMLHNLGQIVESCSKDFGTVFYNGGTLLCGFFLDCDLNKGTLYVQRVTKMIEQYNQEYSSTPIDIRSALCEAKETGLYDARNLLKKTISLANAKK